MLLLSTFWDVFWGMFILLFVFIPLVLLWIFALVDLFRRRGMSAISRVAWLLLIIFLPVIGSVIYLLVRPPEVEIEYRW